MEWLCSKLDKGGGPEVDQIINDKYGIIFRLSGIYPYLRNGLWKFSFVQLVCNGTALCFFSYCSFQTAIHGKDDLNIVCHGIQYFAILCFLVILLCSFVFNRNNLNELHLIAKSKYYQYSEKLKIKELNKWKKDIKTNKKRLLTVIIGYYFIVITSALCVPIIESWFGFKRKEFKDIEMRLPIPMWHPFSNEDPIVLCLLFLYMAYVAALVGMVLCSVNAMTIHIFSGVILQFKILQKSIELLPERAAIIYKKLYPEPEQNSVQRGVRRSTNIKMTKDRLSKCYIFCLKENIEHQILLEKVVKLWLASWYFPAIAGFIIASIVIATSLHALVLGDSNPSVFILSAFLVIGEAGEVTMACHLGQENELVRIAIYDLNWSSFPEEVSMFVKIMMEKSKRPISTKIGGVFSTNHESLLKIMNSSYYYFNLLLAFHTKMTK